MKTGTQLGNRTWLLGLAFSVVLGFAPPVQAHCDTMDGPVVLDAQRALAEGNVTPMLKWVGEEQEPAIRAAFEETIVVREASHEAKDLADRYFFETLVRIHREGEGAPYTGLKPAGTVVDPGILAADEALESGEAEHLVRHTVKAVEDGLQARFHKVMESKTRAEDTVEGGRAYVAAYVEFIHYAERLLRDAKQDAAHHASGEHASHE